MSGGHFTSNVGAAILAAGTSNRMEEIKQLLPWKNTNLVGHVIEKLKSSNAKQIYLVLGAYQDKILNEINTDGVTVIINEDWSLGMGSSIAKIATYLEGATIKHDALLLTTVDQPLLDVNTYNKLINSSINNNRIIATAYGKDFGIPAVFDKVYFSELKYLGQDLGAKSVIKNHLDHLVLIDDPMAAIDLDTKEVYEKYHAIYGR